METETSKATSDKEKKLEIKQTLEWLTKKLVDRPDELSINMNEGDQTVIYELRCAKDEIGKIVGKKGAMAEALRTILKSLSAKQRIRANLEICD